MDYICNDVFMVRNPSLPVSVFLKFMNFEGNDIDDFINQNNLNDFFEKSILVSSRNLYEAKEKKGKISGKKKKSRDLSLIKFLIRSSTRPTPYGLFAGVALGEFCKDIDTEKIVINHRKSIVECNVDNLWLSILIYEMENDILIYNNLKVKFNENCFVSGNRMKNPYYSNHGILTHGSTNKVLRNDIRNNDLISYIKNETKEFVDYNNLKAGIQNKYSMVQNDKIELTINSLIENEILLTNLRVPTNCDNSLMYVLKKLENINGIEKYKDDLQEIYRLINIVNSDTEKTNLDISIIKLIYQLMEELIEKRFEGDLLCLNTGTVLNERQLPSIIKTRIENFVENLSYLAMDSFTKIGKFKQKFEEEYGTDIEVPLCEIIDPNNFNGLSYLENSTFNSNEREKRINQVVDDKIMDCIQSQGIEVELTINDFINIEKVDEEGLPESFDMNFFVTKDNDKYILSVSPIVGSSSGGQMFHRFNNVLDSDLFDRFKENQEIEKIVDDSHIIVEIRETNSNGRMGNIGNNSADHKFYFSLASTCENMESKALSIDDFVIGSDGHKLYVKSRSQGKLCKIISESMLNISILSDVSNLLMEISNNYTSSITHRINSFYKNSYTYVPRILFDGIIVQPKRWKLESYLLEGKTIEIFKEEFQRLRIKYRIDNIVYLCEADNRLILNLDSEYSLTIIYKHIKKNPILYLSELETNVLSNNICHNSIGESYVSEIACNFNVPSNKRTVFAKNKKMNIELQNQNRKLMLLESGWVYAKIYKLGEREDEVLKHVLSVLNDIGSPKFFYIRYNDDGGRHLRLRFKYIDENTALTHFSKLQSMFNDLRENKLINTVQYDIYNRENNRYGGSSLIEYAEGIFEADSTLTINLLNEYNIEEERDIEQAYLVGICTMLSTFNSSLLQMFNVVNMYSVKPANKDIFRRNNKEYIKKVEQFVSNDFSSLSENLINCLNERNMKIEGFTSKLDSIDYLTSTRENIMASFIHMFCNRLTGNREMEDKYLNIVREVLSSILERNKHV